MSKIQDGQPGDPGSDRQPDRHSGRQLGRGVTRRGFITTLGIGAAGVAASGHLFAEKADAAEEPVPAGEMIPVKLQVNGGTYRLMAEPRWTLLFVLREKLELTGTKLGCGRGECGACTVLMDGVARYACMTLAVEAEGAEITTVEGLVEGETMGPVQQAFAEEDAYQCGYCTPGQIMAVEGLLRKRPEPSVDDIRIGVSGNLCRCGAYSHIVKAAQRGAELKKKGGAA